MKSSFSLQVLSLLALFSACEVSLGENAKDALPEWIEYIIKEPGYTRRKSPLRYSDPVQPLTSDEIKLFREGASDETYRNVCKAFVDRAEETYCKLAKPPDGLFYWLKDHAQLRETFLLALNPYYDDLGGAMRILDDLRLAEPEKAVEYYHLAVAISVVWDSKDAVHGSRYMSISNVAYEQYQPLPTHVEVFKWFTDKKNASTFVFKVKDVVWPIAVHLADSDVSIAEAEWAVHKLAKQRDCIGNLYDQVEYDNSKASTKDSKGKLGTREYILPNILQYGGICGDQAHFCSRAAKCFAIPAMKVNGLSRYGGTGHAFTCYFAKKKNRMVMESTGRYFYDYYYSGDVFDPQTRVEILDRSVAMVLDGASLSYEKYVTSNLFARISAALYVDNPVISLEMVKWALKQNWFCSEAWKILMRHVRDQTMSRQDGIMWANNMMKCAKDHPDLTMECFSTFLDCIPKEDTEKRQAFYKQAASLYNDRPDLQVDLRFLQGKELIASGKETEGVELLMGTAAEHGKEGRIINELVRTALKCAKKNNTEKTLLLHLDKIASRYPKKRGDTIAEAFKELVGMIAPVYESNGRTKDAARLRSEAEVF